MKKSKILIVLVFFIICIFYTACREDVVMPIEKNKLLGKVLTNQIFETITVGSTTSNSTLTPNPSTNNKLIFTVNGNDFGNDIEAVNLNLVSNGVNNSYLPSNIYHQTSTSYKMNDTNKTVSFQEEITAIESEISMYGEEIVSLRGGKDKQIDWSSLTVSQKKQKFIDWGYEVRTLGENDIEIAKSFISNNNTPKMMIKTVLDIYTNQPKKIKVYSGNTLISEEIIEEISGAEKVYSKVYDKSDRAIKNNIVIERNIGEENRHEK